MEYFCHIGGGPPIDYLDMLDKLQEQVCRTVGPSHAPPSLYINTFANNCHSQTNPFSEQMYPGLGNIFSNRYIYIYEREIGTENMAK